MVRSTWRRWRRPARWVGATLARCYIRGSLVCVLLGVLCLQATAQEVIRFPAKGEVPPGYPAQYGAIIAAAEREGQPSFIRRRTAALPPRSSTTFRRSIPGSRCAIRT